MDERLAAAVDQTRHLCDICGVPGIAVGVVHHGKVTLIHCLGLHDVDKQLHMDCDTKFILGSVSKSFLAAAIGIAAQEGKMRFYDPLSKYLHDFDPTEDPRIGVSATSTDPRYWSRLYTSAARKQLRRICQ
jgi:CubicO group peptidase (beta-lactamase class C family)